MNNSPINDIFDLSDAIIVDSAHVEVARLAPLGAEPACYRKEFKNDLRGRRNYRLWTDYECRFLNTLLGKGLKHVVQLAKQSRTAEGGGTPLTTHLETFDAGLDLKKWCRIQPRYADGTTAAHPFQHAAQYLQLLRACLVALKEIHQHRIVHGDIKDDNICLLYQPYPYDPTAGIPVKMLFDKLKLIDFAWSVSPDIELRQVLPISGATSARYQSPLLKAALEADKLSGKPSEVSKLDYRVDLYSLGDMAELIAENGLAQPPGAVGRKVFDAARELGPRLKALGNGDKPASLPHDGLIAEIDGWLKDLHGGERGQMARYSQFEVSRVWSREEMAQNQAGVADTPLTPVAPVAPERPLTPAEPISPLAPLDASAVPHVTTPSPTPGRGWVKVALPLAVAGALVVGVIKPWSTPVRPPVADSASASLPAATSAPSPMPPTPTSSPSSSATTPASAPPAPAQSAPSATAQSEAQAAETKAEAKRAMAAQALKALGGKYAREAATVTQGAWWKTKGTQGKQPSGVANWLADGAILAQGGDMGALLHQAYAYAFGVGVVPDRAKALEHLVEARRLANQKEHSHSAQGQEVRAQAGEATRYLLESILKNQDRATAARLQKLMESQATGGSAFFQYYLAQFNQKLFDPQDPDQAVNWYCKVAATKGKFQESAQTQLRSLGKRCLTATP